MEGDPYATQAPGRAPGQFQRETAATSLGGSVAPSLHLMPGDRFEDFEILSELGRGGFGVVYLARQASLDRRVALKISPVRGQEGRALARLDHPHIVTVYSQQARNGLHLLCMQYVPSVSLDVLLRTLRPEGNAWTGADLLAAIDRSCTAAADFDPAQLADRELLSTLDHVGAVCLIGSRLAAALSHAHRQGVLHRDVKPANVLVSQYGRPLLVDFNMASAGPVADGDDAVFGGTLPYMAPEHLAAVDVAAASTDGVGEAADQYSLAVLIHELATGRLPFPAPGDGSMPLAERLRAMLPQRLAPDAIWQDALWRDEPALKAVLQRALSPSPVDRWSSSIDFATALDDARSLRQTLAIVHRDDILPAWCRRYPFAAICMAGVLPNIVGSAVNIPYNLLRVVPEEHEPAFFQAVTVYNALVYPVCVVVLVAVLLPIRRGWYGQSAEDDERLRRRGLRLPSWAVAISVLGWLPAALFFPWALHVQAVELPWTRLAHFHVAILIVGLISVTYSALMVLCVVAFVIYPFFWKNPEGFSRRAAAEVRPILARFRPLPFLAGSIPLLAAALLVTASPQAFSDGEYEAFRLLTTLMIGLGMAGFHFARWAMMRACGALEAFAHA